MPLKLGGYTTASSEPALSAAIGQVAVYPTALSANSQRVRPLHRRRRDLEEDRRPPSEEVRPP